MFWVFWDRVTSIFDRGRGQLTTKRQKKESEQTRVSTIVGGEGARMEKLWCENGKLRLFSVAKNEIL